MISSAFQQTFQHLVTANALLNDDQPLSPPPHSAPLPTAPAGPTPPPHPSDTKIKIIQGRTQTSKVLLHAGCCLSRHVKHLVDGIQSWRCIKRNKSPGCLLTINGAFHCIAKLHGNPADPAHSNAAEARSKIKKIAATSTTSNHKIFSVVTGPLAASNSWFLHGTFKCSPQLFYQLLIIHAELSMRVLEYLDELAGLWLVLNVWYIINLCENIMYILFYYNYICCYNHHNFPPPTSCPMVHRPSVLYTMYVSDPVFLHSTVLSTLCCTRGSGPHNFT